MDRYTQVYTRLWKDDAVLKLDHLSKLVYMYLLTNQDTNICGYYKLTMLSITTELNLNDEEVRQVLSGLVDAKLIKYDAKESLVLIPNYLKYNQIGGEKQFKYIANELRLIKETPLHFDFFRALALYAKKCIDFLPENFLSWIKVNYYSADNDLFPVLDKFVDPFE